MESAMNVGPRSKNVIVRFIARNAKMLALAGISALQAPLIVNFVKSP